MNAPRYVVLSDLHLGAGYSILTASNDKGEPDPTMPGESLVALGAAMRKLLAQFGDAPPPTLILLGDVLDMGLSPMGAVASAFRCFVEQVMLDGERPLFASRVLCVPGNHDHHLWRIAQDQEFQKSLSTSRIAKDLISHTGLFEEGGVGGTGGINSPMLTSLVKSYPGLQDAQVDIIYPNLGLIDEARTRCVVLHHGHYIDPMYRVMSTLNAELPSKRPKHLTVGQLERQNGAWVDFLWSNLGSAGITGTQATNLYEVMRDAGASHGFAQRMAAVLVNKLDQTFSMSGSTPTLQGITLAELVLGAIDATLGQGAESQRDSYSEVMSATDIADLRWYLSGPVALQLQRANIDTAQLDLRFIFGHTHKPFEDELPVSGFDQPVRVFNTGGWVMDQPTMTTTQGASAMFIDDALNIAALRLFNDPVNGVMPPVRARGAGSFGDRDNPMLVALGDAVKSTAGAWAEFSLCAKTATEKHANELLEKFFHTPQTKQAVPSLEPLAVETSE